MPSVLKVAGSWSSDSGLAHLRVLRQQKARQGQSRLHVDDLFSIVRLLLPAHGTAADDDLHAFLGKQTLQAPSMLDLVILKARN